jgi:hypothetical protein
MLKHLIVSIGYRISSKKLKSLENELIVLQNISRVITLDFLSQYARLLNSKTTQIKDGVAVPSHLMTASLSLSTEPLAPIAPLLAKFRRTVRS